VNLINRHEKDYSGFLLQWTLSKFKYFEKRFNPVTFFRFFMPSIHLFIVFMIFLRYKRAYFKEEKNKLSTSRFDFFFYFAANFLNIKIFIIDQRIIQNCIQITTLVMEGLMV